MDTAIRGLLAKATGKGSATSASDRRRMAQLCAALEVRFVSFPLDQSGPTMKLKDTTTSPQTWPLGLALKMLTILCFPGRLMKVL